MQTKTLVCHQNNSSSHPAHQILMKMLSFIGQRHYMSLLNFYQWSSYLLCPSSVFYKA